MSQTINITVWNEYLHERQDEEVRRIYPEGIHVALQRGLSRARDLSVRTATLEDPEHGLSEMVIGSTDVLLWWGHLAHDRVEETIVQRVCKRVQEGMGLIVLHSGHMSKPFRALMGTSCTLRWREDGEKQRLWNIEPGHPITAGIGEYFELPSSEMYGERFDIPDPDKLIFVSWFPGGEIFRSGCSYERGYGRIFYFSPGHESYPIYYNETVLKVLTNAVRWAKPRLFKAHDCPEVKPLETL